MRVTEPMKKWKGGQSLLFEEELLHHFHSVIRAT